MNADNHSMLSTWWRVDGFLHNNGKNIQHSGLKKNTSSLVKSKKPVCVQAINRRKMTELAMNIRYPRIDIYIDRSTCKEVREYAM